MNIGAMIGVVMGMVFILAVGLFFLATGLTGRIPRFSHPRNFKSSEYTAMLPVRIICLLLGTAAITISVFSALGIRYIENSPVQLSDRTLGREITKAIEFGKDEKYKQSLAIYDSLEKRAKDPSAILAYRALLLRDMNELDEAHAALQKAAKINPKKGSLYSIQAAIFSQQNKIDESIASCNKALDIPRQEYSTDNSLHDRLEEVWYHNAYYYRGWYELYHLKQYRDAMYDFERFLLHDSHINQLNEVRFCIAICQYELGEFEAVIEQLNVVKRHNHDDEYHFFYRGLSFLGMGEQRKGEAAIESHCLLQSNRIVCCNRIKPWHNDVAWEQAVSQHDSVRNLKLAKEYAGKVLEHEEELEPYMYDTLAAVDAFAGNFDEAIKKQKIALEAFPGDPELLKRLRLYEQGIPYIESAGE